MKEMVVAVALTGLTVTTGQPDSSLSGVLQGPRTMDTIDFHYEPICSTPGCEAVARYKVAAPWSSGASSELKNYGLACDLHRASQLERGRLHRQALTLADGEVVGEVGLYLLSTGCLDVDLSRLPDQ